MARSKKSLIDIDPDFNDDGSLKARVYETYILKPMEGMGLASDDGALITFTTKVINGVTENYTNGYHANIISALEEIYKYVLKVRVIKKTKLKREELELSEIRDIIIKTNKEFEKLWMNIQKRQT